MRYVYVLRCGTNHYKVGIATYVIKRLRNLQTSNPIKIEVVATRLVENAEAIEKKMHDFLSECRADGGQEWFILEPQQVLDLLVLINQEPEVLAVYDIIEMNALLKKQLEHKRMINEKLDRAIGYINRQSTKVLEAKEKALEQPKEEQKPAEDLTEFIAKAIALFKQEGGRASTSLLQRKLSIGYAKAARIMDRMEELGYIDNGRGIASRMLKPGVLI